jgi:transcriptional regulator of arginine metabolism
MNNNAKRSRRDAIREVLAVRPAADQAALGQALRKRGFRVAQATISRDLRELGLAKSRIEGGGYAYTPSASGTPPLETVEKRLQVMFANFVTGVKDTSHLVLIKTSPGNANGVASLLDSLDRPEILGTIAGDDTVLVVVDTDARRAALAREFRALLQGA